MQRGKDAMRGFWAPSPCPLPDDGEGEFDS